MSSRAVPTTSLVSSLAASILVPLSISLLALPALFRLRCLPVTIWPHSHVLLHFDEALQGLLPSLGFAVLSYFTTLVAVGACRQTFLQRGFSGRDLLKPDTTDRVPESLGLPACCVYLLALFCFIPFRYYLGADGVVESPQTTSHDGGWSGDMSGRQGFPHHELATYLSALLSLLSSLILGFCDDVFDIRWRFKIPIPIIASIPMLLVYYAGRGGTGLVVPGWPAWLRTLVGARVIDLGILYYVYMSLLSVFCTHSINILAGINGVEVGQALIIAASLCVNDALYLPFNSSLVTKHNAFLSSDEVYWLSTGSPIQDELVNRHLFSLSLMLPLVGVCAGLLAWNRHPSLVFVGDTFCYFAGQALACAGVLGHFSKTLLLFFLPQVFNFLLSCPQLFGFVPCPRHRVPGVHSGATTTTLALFPSIAVFPPHRKISLLGTCMLRLLESLRLVQLFRHDDLLEYEAGKVSLAEEGPKEKKNNKKKKKKTNEIIATTNLTLLNSLLYLAGARTPLEHVLKEVQRTRETPSSSSSNPPPPPISTLQPESLQPPQPTTPTPTGTTPTTPTTTPPFRGKQITEHQLWKLTMATQLLGSAFAFAIRYWVAAVVFPDR